MSLVIARQARPRFLSGLTGRLLDEALRKRWTHNAASKKILLD